MSSRLSGDTRLPWESITKSQHHLEERSSIDAATALLPFEDSVNSHHHRIGRSVNKMAARVFPPFWLVILGVHKMARWFLVLWKTYNFAGRCVKISTLFFSGHRKLLYQLSIDVSIRLDCPRIDFISIRQRLPMLASATSTCPFLGNHTIFCQFEHFGIVIRGCLWRSFVQNSRKASDLTSVGFYLKSL